VELALLDSEQLLNRFDMLMVLPTWVLELGLIPVDNLRPPVLKGASVYPSLHILRLDNKYPEPRHDDMIDLRRAMAARQRQIRKHLILMLIQSPAKHRINFEFAARSLGRG
jgi:hypothetical protein